MVVTWHGAEFLAVVDQAGKQSAREFMERVKVDADAFCPKESGALVGTGKVIETEDGAALSYGEGLEYAARQYYDASLQHDNGETDHWSEKAMDLHAGEFEFILNAKLASI